MNLCGIFESWLFDKLSVFSCCSFKVEFGIFVMLLFVIYRFVKVGNIFFNYIGK